MTCPFAKFAGKIPFMSMHGHGAGHGYHAEGSSGSLAKALQVGTARSHRLVEKSKGVSILLQSTPSGAAAASEAGFIPFDRINYVQWNIMLTCVYASMEASLHLCRSHPLLEPIFSDPGLVASLVRTDVLINDVEAHLATIQEHQGVSLVDLANSAREARSFDDTELRLALQNLVAKSMEHAAQLNANATRSGGRFPSQSHIDLLTTAQLQATLTYVRRLDQLSKNEAGLLLAHAYTRYLGDLSGGQHILKKVYKRFPTHNSTDSQHGFEFYHFTSSSASDRDACSDLKSRFRSAMEEGYAACLNSSTAGDPTLALVDEANLTFELNTNLFEALLPAELRMSANADSESSSSTPLSLSQATNLGIAKSPVLQFPHLVLIAVSTAASVYVTASLLGIRPLFLVH
ncbi:heme oxygenase-like protein [Testicularia cyperi]|uniref:Heme oxygenase-like protein n=1 Tax=Testicularia cyperi TaxID=1882483 RepID=A0A317XG26_9BASI|nr:heme oxygenase-like protein [Testicularia cyperi]